MAGTGLKTRADKKVQDGGTVKVWFYFCESKGYKKQDDKSRGKNRLMEIILGDRVLE